MSEELAKQPSSLIEKLKSDNPFLALPAEWVGPASFFSMCKTGLLKSTGTFCANLLYWIKLGLEVEDGQRIFQRLCHPAVAREHNYPNQLEVALNALVDEAIRKRRNERDNEKRREAETCVQAGEIISLADSFRKPE